MPPDAVRGDDRPGAVRAAGPAGAGPAGAGPAGGWQHPGGYRQPADSPIQQVDTWLGKNGWIIDSILAGLAFLLLGASGILMSPSLTVAQALADGAASIGIPLALAFRRRWPVQSAIAVNALALLHWVVGGSILPVDLLIYASVYSTTVHGPLWARRASVGSALLGAVLVASQEGAAWGGGLTDRATGIAFVGVTIAAPTVIAWALGLLRRSTRARWESLRERAARLEYERDQQAVIAASTERARIAREMHDVVAHSLALSVAQAAGGRAAAASDPQVAVGALKTIGDTARSALADTRRILGVLRGDAVADTAPQPGLGALDELVGAVRESGLAVEVVTWGQPVPLSTAADLAVYRVCQESLTNVLKHAGAPGTVHARVDVAWHPQALVVQIDDDGRGAAAGNDGAGNGLLGMRERIALFSGGLESGPRPGGGWRVKATFPLSAVAAGTMGSWTT